MKSFLDNAYVTDVSLVAKMHSAKVPQSQHRYFHSRHSHGFVFWIDGRISFLYDGEEEVVGKENSFVYLPQGRDYRTMPTEDGHFILINFHTTENLDYKPFGTVFSNSAQLQGCFMTALKVFKQKKCGYRAELKSIVYMLISLVQAASSHGYVPYEYFRRIEPAINYMNDNFSKGEVKISELAELCGMSRKYFTKLFSTYYEVTPKQYLLNCQIDYARKLLLSSGEEYSVSDVAERCGFSNVYYFSKLFKQRVGITPSEYRRNG